MGLVHVLVIREYLLALFIKNFCSWFEEQGEAGVNHECIDESCKQNDALNVKVDHIEYSSQRVA